MQEVIERKQWESFVKEFNRRNGMRATRVEVAMNNAYAFGGNNASLIVRKCRT